jgi:hypothetical protein
MRASDGQRGSRLGSVVGKFVFVTFVVDTVSLGIVALPRVVRGGAPLERRWCECARRMACV